MACLRGADESRAEFGHIEGVVLISVCGPWLVSLWNERILFFCDLYPRFRVCFPKLWVGRLTKTLIMIAVRNCAVKKNLLALFTVMTFIFACGEDSTPANTGGFVGQGGQGGQAGTTPTGNEVCDGADNDGDGSVDEGLTTRACSNACGTGEEICSQGGWRDCSAPAVFAEACDGEDNDCDNRVDEGLVRTCATKCGTGQEACTGGDWNGCDAPQPEPEACDNQDNDCDDEIDEDTFRECDVACGSGIQVCAAGIFGECETQGVAIEECGNDLDDDCDSVVDEGCGCAEGDEQSCSGEIGACSSGVRRCDDAGVFGDCVDRDTNEPVLEPGERAEYDATCLPDCLATCSAIEDDTEKVACEDACGVTCAAPCNGVDDDCDGRIDEVAMGTVCSVNVGACEEGQLTCTENGPVCSGGVFPREEACDGLDNDCDGAADEDTVPVEETCDGLDNDCDGSVDEGIDDSFESSAVCTEALDLGIIDQNLPNLETRRSQLQPVGDTDWYTLEIDEIGDACVPGFNNDLDFRYTIEIADLEPNAGYQLCVRAMNLEGGVLDLTNASLADACMIEGECVTQGADEDFIRFERLVETACLNDDGQRIAIQVTAANANACSPYTLRYTSVDVP